MALKTYGKRATKTIKIFDIFSETDDVTEKLAKLDLCEDVLQSTSPNGSPNKDTKTKHLYEHPLVIIPRRSSVQQTNSKKTDAIPILKSKTLRSETTPTTTPRRTGGRARRAPDFTLPLLALSSDAASQHEQVVPVHSTRQTRARKAAAAPNENPEIKQFQTWADEICPTFAIRKIAEGSYGEVYEAQRRGRRMAGPQKVILKVMPIRPPSGPGSRNQSFASPDVVLAEVEMLKRLDQIPGFARFHDLHVLTGRYPTQFKEAWIAYRDSGKRVDFNDPTKASSYSTTQIWAVLEQKHSGDILGDLRDINIFHRWDIFWNVTIALARAETVARFEHRDLHEDNICIRFSKNPHALPDLKRLWRKGRSVYGSSGVEATIIDYTLSRAEMEDMDTDGTPRIAFCDLEKEEGLFADAEDTLDLQRQTYNRMRSVIYCGDACASLPKDFLPPKSRWNEYNPRTNVLWLYFLSQTLKDRAAKPSSKSNNSTTKLTFEAVEEGRTPLKVFLNEALKVLDSELKVQANDDNVFQYASATDVVVAAIDRGWLTEKDVEGFRLKTTKS